MRRRPRTDQFAEVVADVALEGVNASDLLREDHVPGTCCDRCGVWCLGEAIAVDEQKATGVSRVYVCHACVLSKKPARAAPTVDDG